MEKTWDDIRADAPAIAKRRKNLIFVCAELVAEVECRGWIGDGKLRHASPKGLRDKADM